MRNERVLYEFDDFRIDSGQFMLVRHGQPQPITPTVFRILLHLLGNAGRVVTKEELVSNVWPDSYVAEGNLNRNVSTLRKVLGEKPRDHRYIETIPKTGYRFIAPVRQTEYQPANGLMAVSAQPARRTIVGRSIERRDQLHTFDQMKEGRGGIVCLSGENGMGKTALTEAFLADLADRGDTFNLAVARCSEPLTQPEPYEPFLECVSSLLAAESTADLVRSHAPTWHRTITQAAEDGGGSGNGGGRMKREFYELLRQMSVAHPLVLVIDDFHWADIASVELLSFLASRLVTMRVLIVVCVRPVDLMLQKHPFLQARAQMAAGGLIKEIVLPPLTKSHIQELIASELPVGALSDDLASFVLARSEGNPLFAVEILRKLRQDAGFAKRQDAVPDPIRSLIRSRLEPLHETDRGLLAAASVQGYEFDSAILAKSLTMMPEEVEERLQAVCEVHGLIRRLRDEELMDGKFTVRYSFVHALCQLVCQESIPPTRKASLNSAVAEAFLSYYGN